MIPTTVIFVRHGETDDNKNPNWGSPAETPLNAKGKSEAKSASEEIHALNLIFDKTIRTRTQRTKETAEAILCSEESVWEIDDNFAEMRLGNLPDLTPQGIIEEFCSATGYPDPKTKQTLPMLWKELNHDVEEGKPGKLIEDANYCYYDKWRPDADTFQGYAEKLLQYTRTIASEREGTKIIIVCHSTGLKAIYAEAIKSQGINRPVTAFKPLTGAWVHIQIDSEGKFTLKGSSRMIHK